MAKESKYYAVREGWKTGIFRSWDECSAAVNGFSGAQYKSFKTEAEAKDFMNEKKKKAPVVKDKKGTAIAYVDGSYNAATKEYGSGVVVFYDGNLQEISQKGNDPELATMHNVAGEVIGAVLAVKTAVKLGAKHIYIYYDYEGIEYWATGYWQAKKAGTQKYKQFMEVAKTKIKISFEKVKAHTGDTYNERADILAKNALGLASTVVVKDTKSLNLSEKAKKAIRKYPDLIEMANAFIAENNHYEEFDVIDMFFDKHLEDATQTDMDGIVDVISAVYKNNVDKGNIRIF